MFCKSLKRELYTHSERQIQSKPSSLVLEINFYICTWQVYNTQQYFKRSSLQHTYKNRKEVSWLRASISFSERFILFLSATNLCFVKYFKLFCPRKQLQSCMERTALSYKRYFMVFTWLTWFWRYENITSVRFSFSSYKGRVSAENEWV